MNKSFQTKKYGWGLAGLLLLVTFGFYGTYFPKKIAIYPNRQLLWSDFKQVSLISGRESINAICISTTDFEVNRIFDEGKFKKIDLRVKIEQQKELSQVSTKFLTRAKKATKEQVLHHENGHFKIAQIIGHRIVHIVDAFTFDQKNYQAQLDSIVRNNYKDWSLMDREYDHATTQPRNREKQKEWDLFFTKELETLGEM
ncbi:MAG: hypothetical protein WD426_02265 [Anditalea sp.]